MTVPPPAGTRVTVRVDELLSDDLEVLMRTGRTASDAGWSVSDAVRRAVEVLAEVHRNAWTAGAYPEGVEPQITAAQLAPYDGRQTGV